MAVNCTADPFAVGTVDNLTCECAPQHFWNVAAKACDINCTDVDFSNGTINGTTCHCIDTFVWNNEYGCLPNCAVIQNSVGNLTLFACTCNVNSNWNGSACVLNCSTVANSLDASSVNNTCTCAAGFFWKAANLSCWRNCSQVPHNLDGSNSGATACNCAAFYTWNVSQCSPNQLNCTLEVPNSLGNIDNYTCSCPPNFYYSNRQCIIVCVGIPYTTSAPSPTISSCVCVSGYVWDPVHFVCRINCAPLANTTANTTVLPADVCQCIAGFNWINGSCVLNCSAIANAYNLSYSHFICGCNQGWTWTGSFCQLDCSLIQQTTGIVNISTCSCANGYIWLGGQCVIDCDSIDHTDPDVDGTLTECTCLNGYYWNYTQC